MRILRKLFKFALRFVGWCCSLVFGVIFLFLAGYWLGWKFTPRKLNLSEVAVASDSNAARRPMTKNSKPRPALTVSAADDAQERIARLARLFVTSTDKRETDARVATEIADLSLADVYASLAILDKAPSTVPFGALRVRLVERLTSLDPYAALDYAREAGASGWDPSSMLITTVFRRWAFSDAPAALQAWRGFMAGGAPVDEMAMMRNSQYGLGDIFLRLGRRDLNLALAEMKELPVERQRQVWSSLSALGFEEKHREPLFAAVMALPPGENRTEALTDIFSTWIRSPGQKEAALQWLDSAQLSREEQALTEERNFFYLGPMRESAAWVLSRAQSPEERSRRMELAVSGMEPVEAGEWLKSQTLDKTASRAMASYARRIVANDPAAAVEWARSIPEEVERQSALADVEKRIRRQFPHRADQLLKAPATDPAKSH